MQAGGDSLYTLQSSTDPTKGVWMVGKPSRLRARPVSILQLMKCGTQQATLGCGLES